MTNNAPAGPLRALTDRLGLFARAGEPMTGAHKTLAAVGLVLALAMFVGRGVVPAVRNTHGLMDYNYLRAAGECWLAGQTPYSQAEYSAAYQAITGEPSRWAFFYPPQFAPVAILLALPGPAGGVALITLINVVAVAAIILLTVRAATRPRGRCSDLQCTRWLLPCAILVAPATAHLLVIGQITWPVVALIMGCWEAARSRRDVLAGVLLGLASFKPHFILLLVLWFLLERRWRLLIVTMAVSGIMAAYPLWMQGSAATTDWLRATSDYQSEVNALGNYLVMGLPSLLAAAGAPAVDQRALLLVGCALAIAYWFARRRFDPEDALAVLVSIYCTFVYAKYAECLLLCPLLAALWRHAACRVTGLATLMIGLAIMFFPLRLVQRLDAGLLIHWRTAIVATGFAWLLALSLRSAEARGVEPSMPHDAA